MTETTLRKFFAFMADARWDDLASLYAEDATVHYPFANDDSALIVGRERLRAHFAGFAAAGLRLWARDVVMWAMADPAWVTCQ